MAASRHVAADSCTGRGALMVPAGRTTDLTGEALPVDLILIRGQGQERVAFQIWGARIEVLPEGAITNRTSSATDKIRPAVAAQNHSFAFAVVFVLGLALGVATAGTLGATTSLALAVGAAAAAIVLRWLPGRRRGEAASAGRARPG